MGNVPTQFRQRAGGPSPSPPPVKIPEPEPFQRSLAEFHRILELMARYLHNHQQHITIVGLGTGWAQLKAENQAMIRRYQCDVLYLVSDRGPQQISWLQKAAASVEGRESPQVKKGWFKDRYVKLPRQIHDRIIRNAVVENVCLFEAPGLKVLQAPVWFLICVKLNRISETYYRPKKAPPCPSFPKTEAAQLIRNAVAEKTGPPNVRMVHRVASNAHIYHTYSEEEVLNDVLEQGQRDNLVRTVPVPGGRGFYFECLDNHA